MKKTIKDFIIHPYHLIRNKIIEVQGGNFNLKSVYAGHFKVTYRGIPALKCPFDYVIYQMILSELKPDLVIEIGTNHGGTTLYLADLMDAIGHGIIHSIDIESRAHTNVINHARIKLFDNGWKGYDLKNAKGFSRVLIIDDASHEYIETFEAMWKFSDIVTKDSYYIIEDGIVTRLGREKALNGGPLRAIHEFIKANPCFEIDRKYCDMFGKDATFNTDGYLKKIK